MTNAVEKAVMAELMDDRAFRLAWEDFRHALGTGGLDDLTQPDSKVRASVAAIHELLDARPDLAELVERADIDLV